MKLRAHTLLAAVALLAGAPAVWACPNCYGASESGVLTTYYLSTAILTLLPFTIVGGIFAVVAYLRRHAAEHDPQPSPESPPPPRTVG